MIRSKNSLLIAVWMVYAAAAQAQSSDFATGNMHMDVKAMDTDGDGMISKDEFMNYVGKMWGMMAQGADTLPVGDAARDFARGNMRFSAKAMDVDHDGTITKDEFMKYTERKFEGMKNTNGEISVADAAADFARGNMRPATK